MTVGRYEEAGVATSLRCLRVFNCVVGSVEHLPFLPPIAAPLHQPYLTVVQACAADRGGHKRTGVGTLATGRVLQFDATRGYGFVAADDGGEDVFLHASVFDGDPDELVPGLQVGFQVMAGDRGRKAFGAHLVARDDPAAPARLPAAQVAPELRPQPEPGPAEQPAEIDEQMCDVLSADGFGQEITELLLSGVPTLTGQQILQARQSMQEFAAKHGWLDL